MSEKILLVDDEPCVLQGGSAVRMRLHNYVQTGTLRDSFQIQVAAGKQQASAATANFAPVDFSA